jgi:hypothetical protein
VRPATRASPGREVSARRELYLNPHGKVVYTLKTPDRDGTTQIVFEPVDLFTVHPAPLPFGASCACTNPLSCRFVARLAGLVLRPHINLTRYHGVLAPNHHRRAEITRPAAARAPDAATLARPNHPSSAMPR